MLDEFLETILSMKQYQPILLATILLLLTACSGTKNDSRNQPTDFLANVKIANGVKIVFSSPLAASAPDFDSASVASGPLTLLDTGKKFIDHRIDAVLIADVGARRNGDYMQYGATFMNATEDTLVFKSFEFPDSYFDAMPSIDAMKPGMISGIYFRADSAIEVKDYKIVVTFEGDKYPPQTLHLNLYPDILKLHADRLRSDAAGSAQ